MSMTKRCCACKREEVSDALVRDFAEREFESRGWLQLPNVGASLCGTCARELDAILSARKAEGT